MSRKVIFEDLGRIRYKEAWDYQEKLFDSVIRDKLEKKEEKNQYLLFCEHDHVYTIGKSGNRQNLLIARSVCESKQIDLHEIDRGGDITYHGPGQLVVYPIIDLEAFQIGIKKYISQLEDVVIETLKEYGVKGEKDEKAMGVWIDPAHPANARKICAIGVRASRFVTMHGLALNVNSELSYFNYINPCGFTDREVTSLKKELGREVDFHELSLKMKQNFQHVFGMEY
ncbi:MAG: lipoyl(octanoyl) transferase LipB [Proteiniphilum sp.]|nr:lipoyl(octanoyl) transferase LipB [Proteiniphilum sp.]